MKIESDGKNLHISIDVPLKMRGEYTYGEGEWEADAVCVYINKKMDEYALFRTQYLDYKDSLQATWPIAHFENEKEAMEAAEKFNLPIEYARE